MNQIICCLKKDLIEIIRNKRIVMFNLLLFGISAMVLITTLVFPEFHSAFLCNVFYSRIEYFTFSNL